LGIASFRGGPPPPKAPSGSSVPFRSLAIKLAVCDLHSALSLKSRLITAFSNLDFSFPVWLKLFAVFAWPALYFVALPLSIFFDKKQVSAGEVRRE